MKKKLQVANGFFLLLTIIFNYLSNTGIFNGKTIANVSKQYQNLFTPAGYAFSIWGVIYILLIAFVIYTVRSLFNPSKTEADNFVEKIGWWFVVSCVANCVWILTWLYGYIGISVVVLSIALISLLFILMEALKYNSTHSQKWFINYPFQIYSGWVSVALIAAVAAWLTKIEWSGLGLSEIMWTVILIIIASIIHLFMTWKMNAPVFAMVAVWALFAIAVANKMISTEIYYVALSAAGILFSSSMVRILKKSSL